MKSFLFLSALSFCFSFQAHAAQYGETCKLQSIQKDEIQGLAGLQGAQELAIINEKPFFNNAPHFPVVPTSISITVPSTSRGGMTVYKTQQSTSFVDLNGRKIEDMDSHEGPFYALYTHVYKDSVPNKYETDLIVQHYQYVATDHWSSIKAVVRFQHKRFDSNPGHAFADQVYTFACDGFQNR